VKPKKILICGLSGSGKSTLANPLSEMMDAVWLNADEVRREMNDWDFSDEGRRRQANRMNMLSNVLLTAGKSVVADFICPTEETRKHFGADFTIWLDTTNESKFADTDAIFETPSTVDYHIKEWVDFDTPYCYNIYRKIQDEAQEIKAIRDSGTLDKGVQIGHYIKYESNGQKIEDSLFNEDGKFVGKVTYHYYDNGQLKTVKNYGDTGHLSGKSTRYFDDGNIMMEEHFKNHKKHGKEITYNINGTVAQVYTFKEDVLDGPYVKYWDLEDVAFDEGEYRNGSLHGKPDEYFTGQDSKRILTELEGDMSTHSLFTNLETHQTGDIVPRPINRKYFTGETEVWKTNYPTRTDISNIENEKRIIPIFGDSFLFGDGLPTKYELGTLMREECPDILFPNFAIPGAGNNRIMHTLDKWTNDKYSTKTDTIVIAMSSLYRFDFYVDAEHPDSIEGINPFHQSNNEWGSTTIRTYNFSATNSSAVASSLDKELKKKLKKFVLDASERTLHTQTTYANVYFKNLETNLRRLDWITRAKKWNIILVRHWAPELHPTDAQIVDRYIDQMNIKDRSVKNIYMSTDKNANVIDLLDCGHWGHESNKLLSREIKKKL
jgi:adenylylsulfate kinase